MTITRVGTNAAYADGWAEAFGGGKQTKTKKTVKSTKAKAAKKTAAKAKKAPAKKKKR